MTKFTAKFAALTIETESVKTFTHAWLVTAVRDSGTETASGWASTEANAKKAGAAFAKRFQSATCEVVAVTQGVSVDDQIADLYIRRANTCGHCKRATIDAKIAALKA